MTFPSRHFHIVRTGCWYWLALLLCLSFTTRAEVLTAAGVQQQALTVSHRAHPVQLLLWYPTHSRGAAQRTGGNGLFQGTVAQHNAAPVEGRLPLVLMSYGGLRSAPFQGHWLAQQLAQHGYLVMQIQPPAAESLLPEQATDEPWRRAADISVAYQWLQRSEWQPRIDPARQNLLGAFLGATAMLQQTGIRLDPARYRHSCDGNDSTDCRWYTAHQVSLPQAALPASTWEMESTAVHWQRIVVINPELLNSMTPADLTALPATLTHIALGQDSIKEQSTLPGQTLSLPAASPFSALALCTANAAAILREEGEEEALCQDGEASSRQAVHQQLLQWVLAALEPVH
ncbi:hypothetical protein QCD60_08280 [Pokkaliibacter sp. MBI-7]|uniref:alpha/beta hydrolase family protein n=1 Tax=Pokkaliibacter sp. MBI-7 TaxID=3040600 RepID=UPI002448CFA5|nr:hypothetical protein [Pokkaliibacter sp. MBI-7]MDH2432561.1 hypothetical protein [Pokkaliibacter sp. MBI-7]